MSQPDIFIEYQAKCPCCQEGISQPLPPEERNELYAKFQKEKSAATHFRDELNLENSRCGEELCAIAPESLTIEQIRRLHVLCSQLDKVLSHLFKSRNYYGRLEQLEDAILRTPVRILKDFTKEELYTHAEILEEAYSRDIYRRYGMCDEEDHPELKRKMEEYRVAVKGHIERLEEREAREAALNHINTVETEARLIALDRRLGQSMGSWDSYFFVDRRRTKLGLIRPVLAENIPTTDLDPECPICREVYGVSHEGEEAETPNRLPCGHVFGSACLYTWLFEQTNCPTCRRDFREYFLI
jgi:hypothetical protein